LKVNPVWHNGSGDSYNWNFSDPAHSSFTVTIDPAGFSSGSSNSVQNDNYAPVAAAISSITVESMNYFPTGTHDIGNNYSGAPGIRP